MSPAGENGPRARACRYNHDMSEAAEAAQPLRELALRDRHVRLGARFGAFAGWEMPLWYRGALEEHLAVRRASGVFATSHMGPFTVEGPEAGALLASLYSRDPRRLEAGRSVYAFMCNPQGGIIDDLIVYRLADERFLVICNAANAERVHDAATQAAGPGAAIKQLRDDTVLLAVQGPAAVEMVLKLVPGAKDIRRRRCAEVEHEGVTWFLSRTGYTG